MRKMLARNKQVKRTFSFRSCTSKAGAEAKANCLLLGFFEPLDTRISYVFDYDTYQPESERGHSRGRRASNGANGGLPPSFPFRTR